MEGTEEIQIVIVGAGICGLATALALHRSSVSSFFANQINLISLFHFFFPYKKLCDSMNMSMNRKGIRCLILERSKTLRASGAGITVRTNAWCALEQLGVASKLRQTALPLRGYVLILDNKNESRFMGHVNFIFESRNDPF